MWRPRPGKPGPVKLAASRCAGVPLRNARPSPCGAGRWPGLALLLPRAGCGGGAPARPGPHDVGAVGPSAPPARAAALRPALPARPRLRRRPCRAALPPPSPPGVAAAAPRGVTAAKPGPRASGRLSAAPLRGRALAAPLAPAGPQFRPPRALAAQAPPPRAFARGGARGNAACGRDAGRCPGRQGQGKPRAGRQAAHKRGPCLPVPRPAGANRGGCPALCGPPAPSHSGKTVVLLCLLLPVVSLLLAGSGGWSVVLVVSLAGRCPGLPGRSGPLLWRRLLPVSWRRRALGLSGLLVLLSVGWLSSGAGSGPALGAVPCR